MRPRRGRSSTIDSGGFSRMAQASRPFLLQVLAGLLTFYAMAGVWLAMTMGTDRDPRYHWIPLVLGGAAFGISAGIAALAVWRREPRAPAALVACGAIRAVLCIAMPL